MLINLLLGIVLSLQTSDPTITRDWSENELLNARKSAQATFMSPLEQEVLFYINVLRSNPKKFEKTILNEYLKSHKEYSKSYISTLRRDLRRIDSLPLLTPRQDLFEFAEHHATTTGAKGKMGHNSVDGKNFKKRSEPFLSVYKYVGENLHYGSKDALIIVMDLLIDDQIKGTGHRKNFLYADFKFASIAIREHKKMKTNCAIAFGGALKNQ